MKTSESGKCPPQHTHYSEQMVRDITKFSIPRKVPLGLHSFEVRSFKLRSTLQSAVIKYDLLVLNKAKGRLQGGVPRLK